MGFRVATLNLEQDHKRWDARRELIVQHLGELRPDLFTLNEICVPLQTGRWLQRAARERFGLDYALIQQSRVGASSQVDAEGILTRCPVFETANLDYRARDAVAQVVRVEVEGHKLDVYVTHLYMSRGEDPLRLYQAQQLLEWIGRVTTLTPVSFAATSTPRWTRRPRGSWPVSSARPRPSPPHSLPCKEKTEAHPTRIGAGSTDASTTSGCRGRRGCRPAGSASTNPAPRTPPCGPPTTLASGPTWSLRRPCDRLNHRNTTRKQEEAWMRFESGLTAAR